MVLQRTPDGRPTCRADAALLPPGMTPLRGTLVCVDALRRWMHSQVRSHRERYGRLGVLVMVGGGLLWILNRTRDLEFLVGKRRGLAQVAKVIGNALLSAWAPWVLFLLGGAALVWLPYFDRRERARYEKQAKEVKHVPPRPEPVATKPRVTILPRYEDHADGLRGALQDRLNAGVALMKRLPPSGYGKSSLLWTATHPGVIPASEREVEAWEQEVMALLRPEPMKLATFSQEPTPPLSLSAARIAVLADPPSARMNHKLKLLVEIIKSVP